MCKIYNSVGSLMTLTSYLDRSGIYDFKSLEDVINFQKSFERHRQQIIWHHEKLIEQEKNTLELDLPELGTRIETEKLRSENELIDAIDQLRQQLNILTAHTPTSYIQRLTKYIRQWYYTTKIKYKERNFYFEVAKSVQKSVKLQHEKQDRYQFIISRFSDAVKQSAHPDLSALERKKAIIDELSGFIYGAVGEQQVVKALEALSDEYFLINDFAISFSPPIYNRQENDYIKSIQIDHILVGPSGIFLIETKNWNQRSLENLDLRSPVRQIKRTGFALFKLLNNEVTNYRLLLDKHHWGDRKVSVKKLIVFTNSTPREEFPHVKILSLQQLLGYLNYFKPTISNAEVQRIADYLLKIDSKRTIATSRHRKSYAPRSRALHSLLPRLW